MFTIITVMSRICVALVLCLVLLLPTAGARSESPEPGNSPAAHGRGYTLGELIEGSAPLAQLHPDVLPTAQPPAADIDIPSPSGYAIDFSSYPDASDISAFLEELARDYPRLVTVRTIGVTWQGRPVEVATIANADAPGEIEDRPAMYLDGQHHAREIISNQVVLYALWRLVSDHGSDPVVTHLLDTRVLYVVPSVNPDGNDIVLSDYQEMRKSANPNCCDDDVDAEGNPRPDGRFDEDYSVGYGYGTDDLYLYYFDEDWADLYPDNPFRPGWPRHETATREHVGRFTGALGGPSEPIPRQDMDGDGLQDEDEIGGVDLNRNYAAHWIQGDHNSRSDTYGGPEPWSEPESRAVRDFVQAHEHIATALSLHSGTDMILHPWGWSPEAELLDAEMYELLSAKGSELTQANGFPASEHAFTARGLYPGSGSAMDWLYESRGVYAWTPEVYGSGTLSRVERLGATGTFTIGVSLAVAYNPHPDDILATADRWYRWLLYMLAATPNVEASSFSAHDDHVAVALGNDGILPVEVALKLDGSSLATGAQGPRILQGHRATWELPSAAEAGASHHLEMESKLVIGTRPHVVERAEWVFSRDDGGRLVLEEGSIVPFRPVGDSFGGWWSDPRWANYRPRSDVPILAEPPVWPTFLYLPLLSD